MRYRHATIEMIGVSGTNGARNGRGRSGSTLRSTMTPAETSTKANSVPMLVSSTTSAMFAKAANDPTNVPVMSVPMYGVLNRECTLEKNGGRRPSRDMDMKM